MKDIKDKDTHTASLTRIRVVMLLVLALCILMPLAAMNHEPEFMSEADNRMLAEVPPLDEGVDALTEGVTEYMSDRIGFRDKMMAAFSLLNDKAFNLMTHPLYEYGDEGYVFFRFSDKGYDEVFIDSFAAYVRDMQEYCENREIDFLYVISPEKWRIYSEYIPDTVGELPSSTQTLKDSLDAYGVNYIDLGESIEEAKNDGVQVFNPVYDAGHWNSEGMYVGSQAIVDRLQEMGVDVDSIDLGDYQVVYEQETVLPASNYPINETVYTYELKPGASGGSLLEDYSEDLEMSERFRTFRYYENENNLLDTSVLMFQGSYFNSQGKMLQNQFTYIAQIHDYENVFNLPYYVGVFQPDVVIFENADYTVLDNYYSQAILEETTLPPKYNDSLIEKAEEKTGGVLEYDSSKKLVNFEVNLTDSSPKAAYAIIDGTVYDLLIREGGLFYWGVTTEALVSVDEIEVVGIRDNSSYVYRYQLKRSA